MTDGATRLTAVSVGAVVLAMLPLFPITETHGWFMPAVIGIGLVAMAGWALRRRGAPRWLVPLAQVVVLTWWIGLLVAADVAWWSVIPNRAWLDRLVTRVGEGIAAMNEYAPPVPSRPDSW